MSPTDPMEAAAGAKRAAAMLREARALQRRLDKLAGAADVPRPGRTPPRPAFSERWVTPSTGLWECETKCRRLRGELVAIRGVSEGGVSALERADQVIAEHARANLEQEVCILPLLTSSALRLPALCPALHCQEKWNSKWNSIIRVGGKTVDVVAEGERHADTHKHLVHLTEDFTYDAWPAQKTAKATIAKDRVSTSVDLDGADPGRPWLA